MGGSILAQAYNQVGTSVPDIDSPQDLRAFFVTIRTLAEAGVLLAYHDRSDGGLFATLCEMAFAGHTGISVNLDMLTFDPGSADRSEEHTSELQSLMRISYAVFCLKKKLQPLYNI